MNNSNIMEQTKSYKDLLIMNSRSLYAEVSYWFKQVLRVKNFWILLPTVFSVLWVYIVNDFNTYTWLISRGFLENLAIWLISIIFLILATKGFISKDPLIIYLAVLAMVFLIRELDETQFILFGHNYMPRTKKPVDFFLVVMGLWAFGWHRKLFETINRFMVLKISVFGMLWTYLFSQLISRRVFRGILPNEQQLHVPLEETAETAAHLFFLVIAFSYFYFIPNRKK